LSIRKPNKGIEVYRDMRESYETNVRKFRDSQFARNAITSCGEYKSITAENTPKNSGCSIMAHESDALSELMTRLKKP
jgi:hypothetical protein